MKKYQMKNLVFKMLVPLAAVVIIVTIYYFNSRFSSEIKDISYEQKNSQVSTSVEEAEKPSDGETSSKSSKSSANNKSANIFSNKFGTATTKCAHSGCDNYIASSGDTNCCSTHSNRCLECNKYIDEDALYCMDCLSKGVSDTVASKDDRTGLCQFKLGGEYVCNDKATNGNYCEYHYNYLNDAYNSLFG